MAGEELAGEGPTDDEYGAMLERNLAEGGEVDPETGRGEDDLDEEHEYEYRGAGSEIDPIGEIVVTYRRLGVSDE